MTHSSRAGRGAGGTSVASGATLKLSGGITIADAITGLAGTGVSSGGALINESGTNTLSGAVTLTAASTITTTAGTLTLSGIVGGAGFAVTKEGAGTWSCRASTPTPAPPRYRPAR